MRPFKLFQGLMPFSQPPSERQAAIVREQLDTVAGMSSHEMVAELTAKIVPAIFKQDDLQIRFKLLDEARDEAEKALPVLERHIDYSSLPLSLSATSSALAADNLLKALARGYGDIAHTISGSLRREGQGRLFQRAIHRAMAQLKRRQLLAYRSYAKPSPSTWTMLHDLYQLARSSRARLPEKDFASLEKQYISALLLAYLEPGNMPRPELSAAVFCAQRLALHATIRVATPDFNSLQEPAPLFLVRPAEGNAGVALFRLPKGTPVFDGLVVDCTAVMDLLDKELHRNPEDPQDGGLDIPQSILHTIQLSLGGRSTRRFQRKRFKPRANLVTGIAEVIPFLEGDARTRRKGEGNQRINPDIFSPSEWALVDQSPDGFLARFIQGRKWQVNIGNVVALQPKEESHVFVCLVRRIWSNAEGRLDIGLQTLSPEVSVVDLPIHGEMRRALYLHNLPAYGGRPGILAQPGDLESGLNIRVVFGDTARRLQIGRKVESSDSAEFFALIPLHTQ